MLALHVLEAEGDTVSSDRRAMESMAAELWMHKDCGWAIEEEDVSGHCVGVLCGPVAQRLCVRTASRYCINNSGAWERRDEDVVG